MIERFWLFHCAYARVPRSVIVEDGGWGLVRLPFMCGLAEHSELGPILLDAPYGHEGPANLGTLMSSLLQKTGLVFKERWSVVPRLEQLGFRPADLSQILMTHLHYDHTGGMKTLAHANFHLSRREWDAAHDGSIGQAGARGYARDDFAALSNRLVLHEPVPHLADSPQGLDVFGDGSVEMFFLPGHTPGHCGYRLHLKDGGAIFFAGDAAFTIPQILDKQGLGLLPRGIASAMGGVRVSLRALRRHLQEHPTDIPITCHDLELGAQCIDEGPILYGQKAVSTVGST